MSNEELKQAPTNEDTAMEAVELENLQARARMLGVEFHPKLSADKLRERIKEHTMKEAAPAVSVAKAPEAKVNIATAKIEEFSGPYQGEGESENNYRLRMKREASKLVRIVISCKNPAKKEHGGQLFSIGNSVVGSFTKYVPFENQEGWHVPAILLQAIKDAEYQYFYSDTKNPNIRLSKRVKEFVVDILDPLTPEELHDLAQRQAMGKTVDNA